MERKELLDLIGKAKKAADDLRGGMMVLNDTLVPLRDFVSECAEREELAGGITDDITTGFVDLHDDLGDFYEDEVMYLEETLYTMEELARDMPDGGEAK